MGNVMSLLTILRGRRKTQMILFALALATAYYRSAGKGKRRRKIKGGSTGSSSKSSKTTLGKRGQAFLWKLFLPKSLFDEGSFKLLAMVVLNVYRVWQALRAVNLVRTQDLVIFNRDRKVYWSSQMKLIWLCVEMTFTHNLTKYIEGRLGLQWKRKLTKTLHEKYFSGKNFYHAETCLVGADGKPTKDADSRMTEEVEKVVNGYTKFLSAGLFNICTGLFYLGKLWNEYGFVYAGAPFVYIFVARWAATKIAPLNYRRYRELATRKAQYRNGQTRLVVHSEAIASLKGGTRESTILAKMFRKLVDVQRRVHANLLSHSMAVEFLVQKLLWVGCGWAIIGWGVFDTSSSALSRTIQAISEVRADVGYKFVLYTQVVVSALKGSRAMTEYGKLRGECGRIYELVRVLDEIERREVSSMSTTFVRDDRIAFDNVDVYTPTGNLLVKNLSFDVQSRNDSILLTGHNGAGKSSIFRCLAGLWTVNDGRITKPDASATFYLPQKPYNVMGTLVDQLTYPERSTDVSKSRLHDILCAVELEYLLDRPNVMTAEVNWEDELSLGEKQRLAIARVLYHQPRFCILDECTSGVSSAMERRLYHLLNARGISYITISHRPMLESMHCKSLCVVGDEKKTYRYRVLQSSESLLAYLEKEDKRAEEKRDHDAEDDDKSERRLAKLQEARSKPYDSLSIRREQATDKMRRSFQQDSAFSNLRRILSGAVPKGCKTKVLTIVGGIALKAALADLSLFNIAGLFRALFSRDASLLYRLMIGGVAIGFAESAVNAYTSFTQNSLQVDLLESLTKKYMKKYVEKSGYYNLKSLDGRVQDPETRLSDDVDECVTMLSGLMMDVVDPVVKILWLGRRLALTIGAGDAGVIYSYLFAAGVVARWIMPDFKRMTAEKNKADGRLRYALASVRTHSESIAFFGGGDREKELVWSRFEKVLDVERSKLWYDWWFGWYKELFVNQAPERLQQHLRFTFAVKQFSDASILQDGGANLAEGQHMIWGVQNAVKRSIRDIVSVSDKFESLSGVLSRLAEMDVVLDEVKTIKSSRPSPSTIATKDTSSSSLTVRNLDIVTPAGVCMARGVNVDITNRNRLLVTGPNASGKTSLCRVLGGLWPSRPNGKSTIVVDGGSLAIVPQRVYSVQGTLLDQITYPQKITSSDANVRKRARELLRLVGIDYLVDRYDEGLDAKRDFEDVLSLGEQQRLGMARLFYTKPRFAVLDECTDAVSVDVEERLYETATSMGIVVVTISKRLALENYHEQELRLGAATQNGFVIKALRK